MFKVTKEFKFDSAHFLPDYDGACGRMHGHTWRLAVTVWGRELDNGMLIDFKRLKNIVNEEVIEYLDHKVLNEILTFSPTAENLAQWIFTKLNLKINLEEEGVRVLNVRLWENYPESYVDYNQD